MSTTTDDDLDRDEVVIALRREGASQPVRPAPLAQVTARGRRRRDRRRATAAAVSVAAAVVIGAVAIGALGDAPADEVRTAEAPATTNDPGTTPLLVPATTSSYDGLDDGAVAPHSAEMDLLEASGERTPWWRWGPAPQWTVTDGIVLADGRRFASAQGLVGTERAGQLALVELDEAGAVLRAIPLGADGANLDEETSTSAPLVGASGSVVDVAVTTRELVGTSLVTEASLLGVDVDGGTVETIIDDAGDAALRTASGRIVSVRNEVSTTEPCLLDVRERATPDEVRSVTVACDGAGPLPPMVRLLAVDPTGRYAAVERTTMTSGPSDLSLLVVELDEATTTEVVTAPGYTPWWAVTWGADGTLRLAMPTDNPELAPIDVPSPPRGPEVEVVRYRER